VNEHIEQMRLSRPSTARALCIDHRRHRLPRSTAWAIRRPTSAWCCHLSAATSEQRQLLRRLADMQYTRNELDLTRAPTACAGMSSTSFRRVRARGGAGRKLFDDTIDSITLFDPLTGAIARKYRASPSTRVPTT